MVDDARKLITITDPEVDRYASLHLIDWWEQERISNARIMVVGAGALGNEVLKNLALLGVGHLFIVDFDVIEASNLTRSILYRASDGRQPKVSIAAERLRELNSDIKVIAFGGDVVHELGSGVFRRMDVIIGCLDNRAARVAVNQACWNTNRPWIDGALDAVNGLVRVFVPPDGVCYECTMTDQDYYLLNLRYSCVPGFSMVTGRQPTMPTTASIIAALQVQEAIKLLHGLPLQAGRAVYYSWQSLNLRSISYPRRENCPAHLVFEPIIDLPYGVEDLTIVQFANAIRSHVQDDCVLFLPQEVVTALYCPFCKNEEVVYRPFISIVPERIPCPDCKANRTFDVTGTLSTANLVEDVPLTQLGIPALHILPVRSQAGWQYFELSADEKRVLDNW